MSRKSDAKRRAKLKQRRKLSEAGLARYVSSEVAIDKWMADQESAPNIMAELVDEEGTVLAHVESNDDERWTVFVGDEPLVGSENEFVALGSLLNAAVDDQAAGQTCFLQFSQWLLEEIERHCEERELEWEEFLRTLLPPEKRQMKLPPHQLT